MDLTALDRIATQARIDILEMIYNAQSGHVGGSLSAIDCLTALYFGSDSTGRRFMKFDPRNPGLPDRDLFILSKAHCSPALFVTLVNAGYFDKKELESFRSINALLQGHVTREVPGIETSGGGLGQGLSIALGAALVSKREGSNAHVWCMVGDGEIDGGQIWEAALAAVHHKVSSLTVIVDKNQVQMEGRTDEIMNLGNVTAKWASFGWHTFEINGHNFAEIVPALEAARNYHKSPTVIIANTIKGKGGGIAEGNPAYHGKPLPKDEMEKVLPALRAHLTSLASS